MKTYMKTCVSKPSRQHQTGFTLIEMLVALMIFAILSVTGWKIFDSLNRLKAHNQQRTETLSAVQFTYSQLLRDLSQVSPRPVRVQGNIDPALIVQANKLVFTRSGVFDPFNQTSAQERVTYSYDPVKKQLLRYHSAVLDQANPVTPAATVLLSNVDNLVIKALDPAENAQWPASLLADNDPLHQFGDNRLPAGISIDLTIKDQPINWRFSLVKNLPKSVTVSVPLTNTTNNNTPSNTTPPQATSIANNNESTASDDQTTSDPLANSAAANSNTTNSALPRRERESD